MRPSLGCAGFSFASIRLKCIADQVAGCTRSPRRALQATLVTITGPTDARPSGGRTVDFVVEPDRAQLTEIVQRTRNGRLRTNIGNVATLDNAVAAFNRIGQTKGKTIIRALP